MTIAQKKDTRIVPSYVVTTWGDSPYNVKKAHMELVSRMSTMESATESPPLSSQFVSEISAVNHDIPKTIPVKRSTADDEVPKPKPKAKARASDHSSKSTLRKKADDGKQAEESVKGSSSNIMKSLFFFPDTPITHSERSLGFGSYPFGSRLTQTDRDRSNSVIDYAIKTAANEPYIVTATPLEKKKELWEAALNSHKFRVRGKFSRKKNVLKIIYIIISLYSLIPRL